MDDRITTFEIQFKNIDYLVNLCVDTQDEEKLFIEIEEKLSAERWKGVFDAAYIEDLTRKTGNFKQFAIFVSMLETALSRTSDSVSLELFTYADLEQLRNRKSISSTNSSIIRQNMQQSTQQNTLNNNNNKRYLILTYNVEFDRIHYPLQLNYHGKPDPVLLQELIRKLKNELKLYRTQPTNSDSKRNEYVKLQRDYERILKDKEALDLELFECKRELKSRMNDTHDTMQKEIKLLKQMIKNIEEDGLKEKTNYQKQLHKKSKEINQLVEEIEELRASERNLKHQVKSLNGELAVYRRNRVFSTTNGTSNNSMHLRSRESSRENSLTRTMTSNHRLTPSKTQQSYNRHDYRSNSHESLKAHNSNNNRVLSNTSTKQRSASREHDLLTAVANGLRSRSNSYDRTMQPIKRQQSRSPSVRSNGSNSARPSSAKFDPTEYIKNRNRKLEENELKKQRILHKTMTNGSNRHSRRDGSKTKVRTPSVSSINSALDSDIDSLNSYDTRNSKNNLATWTSKKDTHINNLLASSSTPNNTVNNKTKKNVINKKSYKNETNNNHLKRNYGDKDDYDDDDDDNIDADDDNLQTDQDSQDKNSFIYDREKEIKDIDKRLKSLQLFMKNNMP